MRESDDEWYIEHSKRERERTLMKSTKQHLIQIIAQFKYKSDRVNYPINKQVLFIYFFMIRDD